MAGVILEDFVGVVVLEPLGDTLSIAAAALLLKVREDGK